MSGQEMIDYKAFCDLNIVVNNHNPSSLGEICKTLHTYGYRTVALNYDLGEISSDIKKKKKKKGEVQDDTDIVPAPLEISDLIKEYGDKLNFVHRLTFSISDQQQYHSLNQSKNLRKYKLLAVVPTTQSAFQSVCSNIDIDIISLGYESRSSVRMNRKMYNLAVERGVFFEIVYAPAIEDSTARKNVINVAHMYHTFGKSKNVFISSGARKSIHVRGPYDVINLGFIFGLSEEQSKKSVSSLCRALLLRAEGRKSGKVIAQVQRDTSSELASETTETSDKNRDLEREVEREEKMDDDDDDEQPSQKKLKQL